MASILFRPQYDKDKCNVSFCSCDTVSYGYIFSDENADFSETKRSGINMTEIGMPK